LEAFLDGFSTDAGTMRARHADGRRRRIAARDRQSVGCARNTLARHLAELIAIGRTKSRLVLRKLDRQSAAGSTAATIRLF
jgi:hypothetical protein